MRFRAQAAVEWIILLGLAMAVLAAMLSMNEGNYSFFKTGVKAGSIKSTLNDLKNSADFVYSQGRGARTRLYLTLPNDANFTITTLNNSRGLIQAQILNGGAREFYEVYTEANLTGSLPSAAGSYCIDVVCVGEIVNITRSNQSCSGYN
jgi:hypothetical protein